MSSNGDRPPESHLFEAANQLRGSVESAEYKHLVLGLVFLRFVSAGSLREGSAGDGFSVPISATWERLEVDAGSPGFGGQIDDALRAIEQRNPVLAGVLPTIYERSPLGPDKLGSLFKTVGQLGFGESGDPRDLLGRVYEYFVREFAKAEGHRGGEFYTPSSVVRLLVEMLEPYFGRIYDPASGSSGMFVQSARFVEQHAARGEQLSIYGQEMNPATRKIGLMNLAVHGLSGDIALGDSLLDDAHSNLKADFVIANPPFNQKGWGAEKVGDDARWKYGAPPDNNANYAWIQHFASHLGPDGRAGFVLANGSLSSQSQEEIAIRRALIEDDLLDCIVALPGQLFYTTGIPVCLWFFDRSKSRSNGSDRSGEVMFIDARKMGTKVTRTQIDLSADELERIASTYRIWREEGSEGHRDVPGFVQVATAREIETASWTFSPGRYIQAKFAEEESPEAFDQRMEDLATKLKDELALNADLDKEVRAALGRVGINV